MERALPPSASSAETLAPAMHSRSATSMWKRESSRPRVRQRRSPTKFCRQVRCILGSVASSGTRHLSTNSTHAACRSALCLRKHIPSQARCRSVFLLWSVRKSGTEPSKSSRRASRLSGLPVYAARISSWSVTFAPRSTRKRTMGAWFPRAAYSRTDQLMGLGACKSAPFSSSSSAASMQPPTAANISGNTPKSSGSTAASGRSASSRRSSCRSPSSAAAATGLFTRWPICCSASGSDAFSSSSYAAAMA
mmetsp:Transcript_88610/g.246007  ORF Transcript_88610/g.246007 Transcript_88610/m.246007 type:complete len:250 (-) Transcript_88610:187-936(-)